MSNEIARKIFDMIIDAQIGTYTTLYAPQTAVLTISNIVTLCVGLTKYKARKALKELAADGLIYYTSQGCPAVESCGEYRELVSEARPPINGYALTKKAFQSEVYKKKYMEWEESMRKWAEESERGVRA